MVVFGWIMMILLAIVGLAYVGVIVVTNLIEMFRVNLYKSKKSLEASKLDVDERNDERLKRDIILRRKDKELEDTKLKLKTEKIDDKIYKLNNPEVKPEKVKPAKKVAQKQTTFNLTAEELQAIINNNKANTEEKVTTAKTEPVRKITPVEAYSKIIAEETNTETPVED